MSETSEIPAGTLSVVSTPIGNLGDLSPRAREALASSELIACEDTRRTGRLLQLVGLARRPLVRADAHTELDALPAVLEVLASGGRVALVSDAGTPAISDPGQRLVAGVIEAGHRVQAIPGPSSVLAALVVSGLPVERFRFEGFLPRSGRQRAERLDLVASCEVATVVLETAPRLEATLAELAERAGSDREVAVSRELTKLHETTWRGALGRAAAEIGPVRGELVLVLAPAPQREADEEDLDRALLAELATGTSRRDAARAVAERFGRSRRQLYQRSLELEP